MIINELPCDKALWENELSGEKNFVIERKKTFRQLGGDVPDGLIADFDEMVSRLGFVKKRALAAAVSAMIQADSDTQHQWYRDVYERYYSDELSATPAVHRVISEADAAVRRRRRAVAKKAATRPGRRSKAG